MAYEQDACDRWKMNRVFGFEAGYLLMLFLPLNVLSNNGFIQSYGADAIAASPETMIIP